ncbi:MAG: hypothetical protein HQ592_17375, partial [Planctomycetes bacterium]|nr:hypothetical protein [Planctomycetota bacterium]
MSSELIYTSAPRGLRPGTGGFCTVAADGGMSRQVSMQLERLSPYDFHFNLSDPQASLNPVNFSHTYIKVEGRSRSVLSRVSFCGADHTGRTNKIAHHFLLGDADRLPGGPAWTISRMAEKGVFVSEWTDAPGPLPSQQLNQLLPQTAGQAAMPAQAWAHYGDPGWAGMLAKAFRTSKKIPAYLVFSPGTDLLP